MMYALPHTIPVLNSDTNTEMVSYNTDTNEEGRGEMITVPPTPDSAYPLSQSSSSPPSPSLSSPNLQPSHSISTSPLSAVSLPEDDVFVSRPSPVQPLSAKIRSIIEVVRHPWSLYMISALLLSLHAGLLYLSLYSIALMFSTSHKLSLTSNHYLAYYYISYFLAAFVRALFNLALIISRVRWSIAQLWMNIDMFRTRWHNMHVALNRILKIAAIVTGIPMILVWFIDKEYTSVDELTLGITLMVLYEICTIALPFLSILILSRLYPLRSLSLYIPFIPVTYTYEPTLTTPTKQKKVTDINRLLSTLATHLYVAPTDSNTGSTSDVMCVICLTEYVNGDSVAELDCQHRYHKNCIVEWLKWKRTCCMCARTVRSERKNRRTRARTTANDTASAYTAVTTDFSTAVTTVPDTVSSLPITTGSSSNDCIIIIESGKDKKVDNDSNLDSGSNDNSKSSTPSIESEEPTITPFDDTISTDIVEIKLNIINSHNITDLS